MDFNENSVYSNMSNNNCIRSSRNGVSKLRKKKRFSEEQIRTLEVMFGSESKPDPGLKQQLAAELGLQPRQVAIWFQNRRARLKPKQIEREYDSLKASYDALASEFKSLKKENLSLTSQVRTLMEKLERARNKKMSEKINAEQICLQPEKLDEQQSNGNEEMKFGAVEQLDGCGTGGGCGNIPLEMMYGSPFSSSANSEYSCFLDQSSCGSSQWWEFW